MTSRLQTSESSFNHCTKPLLATTFAIAPSARTSSKPCGRAVDVPLPSDPLWKRDFAASVRRLVRDGVDVPLAGLFVRAAQPIPDDAEGVGRARSASEAFIYRRLESLEGTRQRFRLNAELPIPFDGRDRMEVDLLCDDARVVIEVDGALHLGDAEAYRRDRRKDRLLQEHGYTVLRFLAEDLAKDLDTVLDAVLQSLANSEIYAAVQRTRMSRDSADLCEWQPRHDRSGGLRR